MTLVNIQVQDIFTKVVLKKILLPKFDYNQFRLTEIADEIAKIINRNGNRSENISEFDEEFHYEYPPDIIEEFKKGIEFLKIAEIYDHRIDWLVSGDDGEDSFRKRLKEDLNKIIT